MKMESSSSVYSGSYTFLVLFFCQRFGVILKVVIPEDLWRAKSHTASATAKVSFGDKNFSFWVLYWCQAVFFPFLTLQQQRKSKLSLLFYVLLGQKWEMHVLDSHRSSLPWCLKVRSQTRTMPSNRGTAQPVCHTCIRRRATKFGPVQSFCMASRFH